MSENEADQNQEEPSIEEILASIRQIISDDDENDVDNEAQSEEDPQADEPESEVEAAEPEPPPEKDPEPEPEKEDDILDLTEKVEEPKDTASSQDDIDSMFDAPSSEPDEDIEVDMVDTDPEPEPEPQPEPKPAAEEKAKSDVDHLIEGEAEAAVLGAFSEITRHIPVHSAKTLADQDGKLTVESMVLELLRPMLKQWIDQHLPAVVERLVKEELQRLARSSKDE